jgi:glycosyltransferase involved in cell wall biosynthesis
VTDRAAPRRTVLHVDTERGWRGGERQVLWLATALERMGHRSIVAARPREPLLERAAAAGLATVESAPRGELDLAAAAALRRVVRDEGVEIVHAHTGHAVAAGALAVLGTRARLVLTRRVAFRLRRNLLSRLKYARADGVVAISSAAADALAAGGIPRQRITVVPSGVDLARLPEPALPATIASFGIPAGAPLVVQVSALTAEKDPVNFVHAVAAAQRLVPAMHALLVGDGPLRPRVEGAMTQLGLWGVLHLAGRRDDADRLVAAADVVTLSSRQEGLGSVLLDALAHGRPVVATRVGGIPDVVEDEVCGLLVPERDGRRLGDAIARVLSDGALARRLGEAGRLRVRDFSVELMAERTSAVYERVLGRR